MSRVVVYPVAVCFGDCDPAGIVFFPNFSRWMDAASLNFFVACGIPVWRELVKTHGIIGTPLLQRVSNATDPACTALAALRPEPWLEPPAQKIRFRALLY